MKRLCGGVLIAIGLAGALAAIWQLFASGDMARNPLWGARSLAGLVTSGLVCAMAGLVLWLSTLKRFGG